MSSFTKPKSTSSWKPSGTKKLPATASGWAAAGGGKTDYKTNQGWAAAGGGVTSSKSSSSGGYGSGHNLPTTKSSSSGGGGGGSSGGGGGGGGGAAPRRSEVFAGANTKVLPFTDLGNTTYGVAGPTTASSGMPSEAPAATVEAGEMGSYHPVVSTGPAGAMAGAATWFDQTPTPGPTLAHPGFGAQRLGPVASFTPGRGFVRR